MILLLDIGNTYTKLAVYDLLKNKIKKKINIKTIDLLNKNFLLNLLKKRKIQIFIVFFSSSKNISET